MIEVHLAPGEVAVSQRELAAKAGRITQATVNRYLKHLEAAEWVAVRIERGITVMTLLHFERDTCRHNWEKAERIMRASRQKQDFPWLTEL